MSSVTCNLFTLNTQSGCFNCFSPLERQAAMVYLLNQRLIALGGANQTAAQLRSTIEPVVRSSVDPTCDPLDVLVAKQGAINGGASAVSTQTVAQLKSASLSFAKMSLAELRVIEILLRCQLNAYP